MDGSEPQETHRPVTIAELFYASTIFETKQLKSFGFILHILKNQSKPQLFCISKFNQVFNYEPLRLQICRPFFLSSTSKVSSNPLNPLTYVCIICIKLSVFRLLLVVVVYDSIMCIQFILLLLLNYCHHFCDVLCCFCQVQ